MDKLTRQGSSPLRRALYEAAQSATRPRSPDYAHYRALKARGLTHTRASLTIARKIARRSYHLLHSLGPDALSSVCEEPALHDSLSPPTKRCGLPASSSSFRDPHGTPWRS